MDKSEILEKVRDLGEWYQGIEIFGQLTSESHICKEVWKQIRSLIPYENLNGKRILDLGSNAGYYSVRSALEGADVVAVESAKRYHRQFEIVKKYFEYINKTKLNIQLVKGYISDLDFKSLGKFDCILAIAILYHIGAETWGKYTPGAKQEQFKIIGKLTELSNHFVVRTRPVKGKNDITYFNKIFGHYGFIPEKVIGKNNPRSLVLYSKG